jgi:hypothetical protein
MSGRWVALERAWHDTNVVHCSVCGTIVPRRIWLFDGGDGEIGVCGPDCERLYETYWKPTYGVMSTEGRSV